MRMTMMMTIIIMIIISMKTLRYVIVVLSCRYYVHASLCGIHGDLTICRFLFRTAGKKHSGDGDDAITNPATLPYTSNDPTAYNHSLSTLYPVLQLLLRANTCALIYEEQFSKKIVSAGSYRPNDVDKNVTSLFKENRLKKYIVPNKRPSRLF